MSNSTSSRYLLKSEHHLIGGIIGGSFSDEPVNQWIFGGQESMQHFYMKAAKKLFLRKGYGQVETNGKGGWLLLPPDISKHIPPWSSLDIAVSMIKHSGVGSLSSGMAVDEALLNVNLVSRISIYSLLERVKSTKARALVAS